MLLSLQQWQLEALHPYMHLLPKAALCLMRATGCFAATAAAGVADLDKNGLLHPRLLIDGSTAFWVWAYFLKPLSS
jgi:hypothetical protein